MDVPEKHQLNVDKSILDLFYKLADKSPNSRINACATVLKKLLRKQHEMNNQNELCKDLQYTVQRLVKGLASPRDAARLGYTLLLTEILKHIQAVQIDEILEHIKKHLSISTKLDKRDILFGQLFAYTAIVRSGRLLDHSHLPHVILSLYDLWQGKSYTLNACYEIILDLFNQLSKEKFKENVWPHLKKKISCGWENCTPDLLWLVFLCLHMFPEAISEKYLKKYWGSDIFSAENFDHLKRVIKQTSACLPMLHPTCIEFLELIKGRNDFSEIWIAVVDENLFEMDQPEKAFIGFQMIKRILQMTQKKKVIKCVLSSRFRIIFIKSFLNQKHPMNPAAGSLAGFFCDYVKSNAISDIQIIILKTFMELPSAILIDQIFKRKEVSIIIQNLLPEAVKSFCEILKILSLKKKEKSLDDDRENKKSVQALYQIGILVSHPVTLTDMEWRMSIIKFLFLHSFFRVNSPSSDILHCDKVYDDFPTNFRESCTNSFFKAVDSLYLKTENQVAPLQQFLQWMLLFTEYVDQLMAATENVTPLFPIEKVLEPWNQMKSIVHKLNKQNEKDGKINESNAFQVLFLQLGLLLFQDSGYIVGMLEELHICCKKALKKRKHSEKNLEDNETEPPWVGVVIDILLSLLSKSSSHIRRVVTSVFPLFCPFITQEALQQILDVINPQAVEDEPMLVNESDEGEGDEGKVEFDSGSSSEESDDQAENSAVDEEFKKKIKDALGCAADASDSESVVLSDSEMFKLDDALSDAFRSRIKSGSTHLGSADKTMLHFRVRCFDLIRDYLKSEPPMAMVLKCIEPILAAYEYGHHGKQQKQLLERALSTLERITRMKKFRDDNVEKSELKRLLDLIISKCHKETDISTAKKLYSLCVFLVLCFRKLEADSSTNKKKSKNPPYMKIYLSALDTFAKGSSHIVPQFFTSLMEACPELAWNFIGPFKSYAFDNSIRMYKKTQCFGLLCEAFRFTKSLENISESKWIEFGSEFIPAAVETLKKALKDSVMKPVYLTELLNVIETSRFLVKEKTNQSLLENYPDLLPLLNSMDKSDVKKLPKKGKSARRRLIIFLRDSKGNTDKPVEVETTKLNSKKIIYTPENGINSELCEVDPQLIKSTQEKVKSKRKFKKKEKLISQQHIVNNEHDGTVSDNSVLCLELNLKFKKKEKLKPQQHIVNNEHDGTVSGNNVLCLEFNLSGKRNTDKSPEIETNKSIEEKINSTSGNGMDLEIQEIDSEVNNSIPEKRKSKGKDKKKKKLKSKHTVNNECNGSVSDNSVQCLDL